MIQSHIRSNRGSTLAMMIMVIGILVILGIALLTATFVGYTAKLEENRKMTALYVAEAGLDEAYAYLGEEVENANEYSRTVYMATEVINHPEDTILLDKDFKEKMEIYYQEGFKTYFKTNQTTIIGRLKTALMTLRTANIGANGEIVNSVTLDDAKGIVPFIVSDPSSDTMSITLATNVTKKAINKTDTARTEVITATLQIKVPSYQSAYYNASIQRNALFDKTIATDGDFIVQDGPVTVNGNLFAHGTGSLSFLDPKTIGGIILGGEDPITAGTPKSGTLTVNGNVDTARYVRIAVSSAPKPSKLTIRPHPSDSDLLGNLTCNSLVIQDQFSATSSSNSNAKISIIGDATVLDDTELNALKSSVSIDGSYFGFSNGSSAHDQSSGIIINTTDIESGGSKLTITGAGSGKTFPNGKDPLNKGVYIAGTVYIEQGKTYVLKKEPSHGAVTFNNEGAYRYIPSESALPTDQFTVEITDVKEVVETKDITVTRDSMNTVYGVVDLTTPYQSADSVSVVGNYLAYGRVLDQLQEFYKKGSPGFENTEDFDAYNLLEENYFTEFTPLDLVDFRKSKPSESPDPKRTMNFADKAQYAIYVNKQEPTLLNLANGNISLATESTSTMYALGTYINKSTEDTNKGELKYGGDIAAVSLGLANIGLEYNYNVNALSDPQQKDYIALKGNMNSFPGVKNWLKDDWHLDGSVNIKTEIPSKGLKNKELQYVKNTVDSRKEVLILLGSDFNDDVLKSIKAKIALDPRNLTTVEINCESTINGLVLAHGDIYCLGKIDYKGLLLTEKNIYCLDDKPKTFTNINTSEIGNYVTDLALDGLSVTRLSSAPGYWFRQDPLWIDATNKISKNIDGSKNKAGASELGYPASLGNAISVTGWHREPY